jgi:hypothetical protein
MIVEGPKLLLWFEQLCSLDEQFSFAWELKHLEIVIRQCVTQ